MGRGIEATGIRLSFGRTDALAGVDLSVEAGEVVVLVGPNGAGKTCLLRVLAGLIRPQSGHVACGGAETPDALRRVVSYCPDHGALYPATASATGALLHAAWPGWDAARFADLLAVLEVPPDQPATVLSRGQQARLRLAMALSRPAEALVLDEPLAGIDLESRAAIVRLLAGHIADSRRAMIVATHELAEVERLADRLVVLAGGRIQWDEDADALRGRVGASLEDWVRGGIPVAVPTGCV
jgi:ABC-2 type transport system ATP-binding protein